MTTKTRISVSAFIAVLFICSTAYSAFPPPYQPNSWTTNVAGTVVRSAATLSVNDSVSGKTWEFFGVGPNAIARLTDVAGGAVAQADLTACSNVLVALSYVIGANATNYVNSRAVALSNLSYSIGLDATNYTDSRAVALSNLSYAIGTAASNLSYTMGENGTNFTYSIGVNLTNFAYGITAAASNLAYTIGANGTNFAYGLAAACSNLSYAIGANGTNFALSIGLACTNQGNSYSVALSNLCYVIGANGTNHVKNPAALLAGGVAGKIPRIAAGDVTWEWVDPTAGTFPAIVTNSISIPAGSMAGIHPSATAYGGITNATAGFWTNADVIVNDQWLFAKGINNAVTFRFTPGIGFSGQLQVNYEWMSTNALNGASNVMWGLRVAPVRSNDLFGTFIYDTNVTCRFWSSNSVQTAYLPVVTVTNYNPNGSLLCMFYRAATNTADEALGAARLENVHIRFTSTNWVGGYP